MWPRVAVVCADQIFICGKEYLQLKFFPGILSFLLLPFKWHTVGRNILMYEVLSWIFFLVRNKPLYANYSQKLCKHLRWVYIVTELQYVVTWSRALCFFPSILKILNVYFIFITYLLLFWKVFRLLLNQSALLRIK